MNLFSNIFFPSSVYAASNWTTNCVSNGVAKIQGFECIFQNIAQYIIYFAGLAFFFMFIKGGFTYITSGGDPKKTAKATSVLTTSAIGLVGVIVSFLIIKLIGNFTGVNTTNFSVPNNSSESSSVIDPGVAPDPSEIHLGGDEPGNNSGSIGL